jgi:hypothetical protein
MKNSECILLRLKEESSKNIIFLAGMDRACLLSKIQLGSKDSMNSNDAAID